MLLRKKCATIFPKVIKQRVGKSSQVKMIVGTAMWHRGQKYNDSGIASIEDAELACLNLEIINMAFVGIYK
jgi:hypothetical protein